MLWDNGCPPYLIGADRVSDEPYHYFLVRATENATNLPSKRRESDVGAQDTSRTRDAQPARDLGLPLHNFNLKVLHRDAYSFCADIFIFLTVKASKFRRNWRKLLITAVYAKEACCCRDSLPLPHAFPCDLHSLPRKIP